MGRNREILPNLVLQDVENSVNDILIKPENLKTTHSDKKKRSLWSDEEIEKLYEAFKYYDKKDFKGISDYIGTRTIA